MGRRKRQRQKAKADPIIANSGICASNVVARSQDERWYDIRWMTSVEIDAFVADRVRSAIANEESQVSRPN